MVIMRRMSEHQEFDPDGDYKRLKTPNKDRKLVAIGHLAGVVRDVFELPTFDGDNGLLETELLNVLHEFNQQMGALKKNTPHTPEPSQSSGKSATPAASQSETSTSDSLGSGLTLQPV
jgi:hypothetical protein